jgi:tRNA dimethylallyltransferase
MNGGTSGTPLRVICGPTGGGKTQLVVALADALSSTTPLRAVSADSRQLYHGFAIGTAAPTAAEQARVPHVLVGSESPLTRFTAAHWASAAEHAISSAETDGITPVVVGGTGFYVRALVTPLFDEPDVDAERRTAMRSWMRARSHEELARWATQLDGGAEHPGRAQRERAIELALLTGVPMHRWRMQSTRARPRAVRYLVVDPGALLSSRLESRLEAMLRAGWVEEVGQLRRVVPVDAPAWQACGYLALLEAVQGTRTLASALEQVRIETRQYVKRQRTWFRHQLVEGPVTRLDPTQPDAMTQALKWWHDAGPDPNGAP